MLSIFVLCVTATATDFALFSTITMELILLISAFALLAVGVWTALLFLYFTRPGFLVELFQRWSILHAGFVVRNVDIGKFSFSYIERGSHLNCESTILLIHGFAATKDVWCTMANAFPQSSHLIAIDLPGHGKTTRKHHEDHSVPAQVAKLHQFVEVVGLHKRKLHLTGISMGGHIAGVYAAKYPTVVSSLTLMCPAGIDAPVLSDFIAEIAAGGRNYLIPETPEDFFVMMNKVAHKEMHIPYCFARMFTEARKPLNQFFKKVLDDITHPNHRFLLHEVLEDIAVPTLVLWGEHDKILDVSAADVIKGKVKNCQVHILDRCGHAISFERPWKSAKLILQFISSLPYSQ